MAPLMTAQTFVSILTIAIVIHVILVTCAYLIYFERKISAYIQDRIGPNRVGFDFGILPIKFGFWGLGQSLADGLKFLLKEDYAPNGADKALFTLGPVAIIIPALIGWAVIPWGGWVDVGRLEPFGFLITEGGPAQVVGANVNIGLIWVLAVASLGVYGVTLGGWASNNKYSFLGALRCTAGMISYEIPLGLSILAVVILTGTVQPDRLTEMQISDGWLVLSMPLAALLFFVCILAEANRAPFDNAEAEQELVGGYHTEYSSMRFALFFLAEYAHMITSAAILCVLFFGGYHLPLVKWTHPEAVGLLPALVKFAVLFTKVVLIVCFEMVIRWTVPRIRYDQVLKLAWGGLIPVAILLVVSTAVFVHMGWTAIWQMLALNVGLAALAVFVRPFMPHSDVNKRLPMAGSRFCPLPGENPDAAPSHPVALHDDGLIDRTGRGLVSVH
ncbi:MAG: NADH-quinone oxidoreductase subunit H [Phycisphaerales bacterium]|nr:NADH-quinone oxidoreductase subunit H [Phycisphaerales bacterium]